MSKKRLPPGIFEELVEALGSYKKAHEFAEWSNYGFNIIMFVITVHKNNKKGVVLFEGFNKTPTALSVSRAQNSAYIDCFLLRKFGHAF